jgi:hypothetical protein
LQHFGDVLTAGRNRRFVDGRYDAAAFGIDVIIRLALFRV